MAGVLACALSLPVLTVVLSRRPALLNAAKYGILAAYVLANLSLTLLGRSAGVYHRLKPIPFWSYRAALDWEGSLAEGLYALLHGNLRDAVTVKSYQLLEEIVLNVLLYVPLGYLLPFTWPQLMERGLLRRAWGRLRRRTLPPAEGRRTVLNVVLIGLLCSAATELTQLVFKLGTCEFDDLFGNTLGCLLGCVLYLLLMKRRAS